MIPAAVQPVPVPVPVLTRDSQAESEAPHRRPFQVSLPGARTAPQSQDCDRTVKLRRQRQLSSSGPAALQKQVVRWRPIAGELEKLVEPSSTGPRFASLLPGRRRMGWPAVASRATCAQPE